MASFSKILCVVDPTCDSQPAMKRAIWLAGKSGASIDLLVCFYTEYLNSAGVFDPESLEKARREMVDFHERKLEALADTIRADKIPVSTHVVWDHPLYEGIARQAIALQADVVFKDTHYHSALSRIFLTNTDWSLMRICPVPLWLVSPKDLPDEINVIAAIDPCNDHDKPAALDDQMLSFGEAISSAVGANLHAFHSFDPRVIVATATSNSYIPMSLPLLEIEKQMRIVHQKKFDKITQNHSIPENRAHLLVGLTHEELPELANELDAVLVIMGAVSRSRLKRVFIGATAERTLGELSCDLLVVKPNPFETSGAKSSSGAA